MEKFTNLTKTHSSYRYGAYHVGRTDMWGNYCPETGEYYLAHNNYDPVAGDYVEVIASACYQDEDCPDTWEDQSADGFEAWSGGYEVVRELLQLGHLTAKTLASFIEAGGEVWWNQP